MNITHLLGIFFAVILLSGSVPLNSFAENEMMVSNTIQIPKKHLEHDNAIPSHIQNNTGWDREIFHEYKMYEFSDEFGYFLMPYTIEGDLVNQDIDIFYPYGGYFDLNLGNVDLGLFNILIPNSLFPNETFNQYFHFMVFFDGREQKNIIPNISNTHTHLQISLEKNTQIITFLIIADNNKNSDPMVSNGVFNEITKENYDYIFPPLKQTQNGIEPQNIICKENLELILHTSSSPACVHPESVPKLIERGRPGCELPETAF